MTRIPTIRSTIPTLDTRIARPTPKATEAHYGSAEHQAWRLEVKRRAGWKCQHPGCAVHHPARLFADHIIEIKDGGSPLDPTNGQALCGSHHTSKTAAARGKRMKL